MGRTCSLALVALLSGCLTVTHERPAYQELDSTEKAAVDTIISELTAFDGQVKSRTTYNIDEIVDRERISVNFEGMIFTANIGDSTIHVATWENLSDRQRALVQKWFGAATPVAAAQTYRKFFYQFMAVVQGSKEFMYKVLTPGWVFSNRSLFNIERDSVRTALAHYAAVGRRAEMWSFLEAACAPVKAQYGPTYAATYSNKYLAAHALELADPTDPSGYMYYFCRWIESGFGEAEDLTRELNWLRDLPLPL
jgi:hypothetical protein